MKIAEFSRRFEINGHPFAAGAYVLPDDQAADIGRRVGLRRPVRDLGDEYRPYRDGADVAGRRVLLLRTGGFGDLLFLTPLARALKDRGASVLFATRAEYFGAVEGCGLADRAYPVPLPLEKWRAAAFQLHFEGTVERSTDPDAHAIDLFLRHAGIDPETVDRSLSYTVDAHDANAAKRFLKSFNPEGAPVVAVHAAASHAARSYPARRMRDVLHLLGAAGVWSVVLGSAGQFPSSWGLPRVVNLCGARNIAESVAMMAAADVVLGPDSCMVHFAGAIGKPTVALYGPFPGSARTSTYPACRTLSAVAPCAPCFIPIGKDCPRQENGESGCWSSLPPATVAEAVLEAVEAVRPASRTKRAPGAATSVLLQCEAGDLIACEPAIAALKQSGPVRVHVRDHYRDLVAAMGAEPRPVGQDFAGQVVNLERMVEEVKIHGRFPWDRPLPRAAGRSLVNMTDLFLELAGEDASFARRLPRLDPSFPVVPGWAADLPENAVVVFPFSGTRPLRSLRRSAVAPLAEELLARGMVPVFADGKPLGIPLPAGALDVSGRTADLREAAGLIVRVGRVLSPESGPMHMAAALDVPAVVFAGSFDLDSQAAYYPTVLAVERDLPCLPCNHPAACPHGAAASPCMDFEPAVLAEACAARFLGRMPARGIVPTDGATVLILSYDTRDLTRRCLETFLPTLAFDRHVRRVRVVDNGSRDGSPRMLAGFGGVPKVELLFREENRGIYPEWNAAARETTGDLVILGSDTEALSWNWLRAMRYLVRTNERAGIVACRQVRPEGPEGRLRVNFGGINETGSGPIHRMGWDDEGAWDRPTRHSWVTHSAVLVRRAVFDAIGGYDEAFKVYSGDSMFGRTATASGFECWYTPHGRVLHWEGRTVSACRGRGELSVADYEADWAREREFRARKTG